MLDFNHTDVRETPLSIGLNELIERSEPPSKKGPGLAWRGRSGEHNGNHTEGRPLPRRARRCVHGMAQGVGGDRVYDSGVIAEAFNHPDLYAVLFAVAAAKTGKEISPDRLGRWLARNKGQIVNRLTLVRTRTVNGGFPFWAVRALKV
jgi:hypothetical protein